MHIYTNKQFHNIEEKLRQLHKQTLQQVLDYAENNRTYTKKNKHKYIQEHNTRTGKHYTIYRQWKSYGTYNNLQDALRERDLLIQYDWDEDLACEYQYEDVTTPVFPSRVTRK